MDIKFERFGESGVVVKYEGKLNLDTAAEYGTTVRDFIEDEEITDVVLDFEKIDYISSIGIRVIVELDQRMMPPNSLRIINLGEQVIESLRLTGLDKYLKLG